MAVSYVPVDRSVELREIAIGTVLREAAAEVPDAPALVNGSADPAARRRWTYAELLAAAEGVAVQLLARLQPGERLAIWSVNVAEWELVQFGAALAGIPVVAINPAYTAAELEYVLGQSGCVALVLGPPHRGTDPATELAKVRDRLPVLRETFTLAADSPLFAAPPGRVTPWWGVAAGRRPREPGDDAVHLGHHRPTEGGDALPPLACATTRGCSIAASAWTAPARG